MQFFLVSFFLSFGCTLAVHLSQIFLISSQGSMFAHHFDRREHMSEPKLQLQPYGVPLTKVTLMRRTSKLDIVPPHKETLDHPKPFI